MDMLSSVEDTRSCVPTVELASDSSLGIYSDSSQGTAGILGSVSFERNRVYRGIRNART